MMVLQMCWWYALDWIKFICVSIATRGKKLEKLVWLNSIFDIKPALSPVYPPITLHTLPNAIMMDIRGVRRDWRDDMPWSWRFALYDVHTYLDPPALNANGLHRLLGAINRSLINSWALEKSGDATDSIFVNPRSPQLWSTSLSLVTSFSAEFV